jgi:hypothetical protein
VLERLDDLLERLHRLHRLACFGLTRFYLRR